MKLVIPILSLLLIAAGIMLADHISNPTWPPGGEIDDTTLDDEQCEEDCVTYEIYDGPSPCDPPYCNEADYIRIETHCETACNSHY